MWTFYSLYLDECIYFKGVERNHNYKDKTKSNRITKYNQELNEIEVYSENNDENNDNISNQSFGNNDTLSDKVLEPLEVYGSFLQSFVMFLLLRYFYKKDHQESGDI